jgi:aminocarboxymuconate-semialdehyde decarboxylase
MIDVHAHAVLDTTMGRAGAHGPELVEVDGEQRFRSGGYELCGVRYRGSLFMEPSMRLDAMDAAGIDLQVLSPNPLSYFTYIDADAAVSFAQVHNDALAELVRAHPNRFLGVAQLPTQDPDRAADELRRSVQTLGLRGAYVSTDLGGRSLDDPRFDPIYAACVELDVPLFVHPSISGIDGPLLDPRTRRWDLDLIVGFAYEETLAVAALVFGGVLQRHPNLDVCLSHGGGASAFLAGRFRRAAAKRAWVPDWLREPGAFDDAYGRLWFDVHVGCDESLDLLKQVANPDRLVFGTNFGGWDSGAEHPVEPVVANALSVNARRLLRIG